MKGIDIVGKMSTAPGQHIFMLILTDYFTKWVEAEVFTRVRDQEVKSFAWKSIICRFDIPKEIVTDNGSQFISHDFQELCERWEIKLSYSTPCYPQSNDQSRIYQQNYPRLHEEASQQNQRKLGRRVPQCHLVLPHHAQNFHRGDTLLPSLQCRSHPTSRSQHSICSLRARFRRT